MTRERLAKPIAPLQRAPDVVPKTRASSRTAPLAQLPRTLEAKPATSAQLEIQRAQQLEVQRLADLEIQRAIIQRAHDDRFTQARTAQTSWHARGTKTLGVQRAVAEHARTARDANRTRAAFIAQRQPALLESLVAQRLEAEVCPALPIVQRQTDLTLSHVADHFGSKAAVQLAQDPDHLSSYAGFKNAGAGLVKNFRTPGSSHTMPELAKAIQRFRDPMQRAAVESAAYAAFGSHPTYPKQLQRALEERDSKLEAQRESWQRELEPVAQRQALEEASGEGAAGMIESARGSGQPLPAGVRALLETKWNTDLSKVRVHTDSRSSQISKKLNAKALTTGQDIFFGASTFNPTSLEGLQLIAHEAWHTVQQAGGLVQAGIDRSASLEVEARGKGAELSSNDVQIASSASVTPSSGNGLKAKGISNHMPKSAVSAASPVRAVQRQPRQPGDPTRENPKQPAGQPVGKLAVIGISGHESDADTVESSGVALRSKPDAGSAAVGSRLLLNTKLYVNTRFTPPGSSGTWCSVTTNDGRQGWVKATFVQVIDYGTDPEAKLVKVPSGAGGFAINLAKAHFSSFVNKSNNRDQDLRFFVNVLEHVNRGRGAGIFKPSAAQDRTDSSAWKTTQATAGEYIWIPGLKHALSLVGTVPGGSLTTATLEGLKSAAGAVGEFALGGAAFVAGIFHGIGSALFDMAKAILDLVWGAVKGIFTGSLISDVGGFFNSIVSAAGHIPEIAKAAVADVKEKWNQADLIMRWEYRGWLIGNVLANIVLMLLDGIGAIKGLAALGKAGRLGKIGQLAIRLEKLPAIAAASAKLEMASAKFAASPAGKALAAAVQKANAAARGAANSAANTALRAERGLNNAIDAVTGTPPQPALAGALAGGGSVTVAPRAAAGLAPGAGRTAAAVTSTAARATFWTNRLKMLELTYSKFSNWPSIKGSFLGKVASEANLPPGYRYAVVDGVKYAYLETADATKVPLLKTSRISKGEWDVPKSLSGSPYRIADGARYAANYGTKILQTGSQIHHLIADNIWRRLEVLQEVLRRGVGNMDQKANLIELGESAADVSRARAIDPKFPEVPHQSSHSAFDDLVETRVRASQLKTEQALRKLVPQWSDKELLEFVKRTQDEIRDLFLNHPDQLPKKSNGTLGFMPGDSSTKVA